MKWPWSRHRDSEGSERPPDPEPDPLQEVRWIPAGENPFGVEVLDCRPVAQGMFSTTQDQSIAAKFAALRSDDGGERRGTMPEKAIAIECELRFPHSGETRDGPLFRAEAMEDKWDIDLYDGSLYFSRSWTGSLIYRAEITFGAEEAVVRKIFAPRPESGDWSGFAIASVEFLIQSHLYRKSACHPVPGDLEGPDGQLALSSYRQFGRYARFGRRVEIKPEA